MSAARYEFEDESDPTWLLIETQYFLGHTYDKAIVTALRKIDPAVAPLWVVKTYDAPGYDEPQTVGRHILARLIDQPRVKMSADALKRSGVRGVIVPSPLPEELKGLTSGPYFVMETFEGPSPGDDKPGEYLPMTWETVERARIGDCTLRNHRIDDLARGRLRQLIEQRAAPQRQAKANREALLKSRRESRLARRGELVRISPVGQTRVEMSSQLMRLRKIASAGDEA